MDVKKFWVTVSVNGAWVQVPVEAKSDSEEDIAEAIAKEENCQDGRVITVTERISLYPL